jgi:hypothetical protein
MKTGSFLSLNVILFLLLVAAGHAPRKISMSANRPMVLSFTVNSTNFSVPYDDPDTDADETQDGICADKDGKCTLGAALGEAAAMDLPVEIRFAVQGTINPMSYAGYEIPYGLPSGSKLLGTNQTVTIGSSSSAGALMVTNHCVVEGLVIQGLTILGNHSVIGGYTSEKRNVIQGSMMCLTVSGDSNTIVGNYIGTNVAGSAAVGAQFGVFVAGKYNTIGGTSAGARNIVSGNKVAGISIAGPAANTIIKGNYIGLNAQGTSAIPNNIGVEVLGWDSTFYHHSIGDTVPGARNVISGNTVSGIEAGINVQATVSGNFIGTNAEGSAAIGNGLDGIHLLGSARAWTINSNLISGNGSGITSQSVPSFHRESKQHKIYGNMIGTDVTGLLAIPNEHYGIFIAEGSSDNVIGSSLSEDREMNIIAYNKEHGIAIMKVQDGLPVRNTIRKNSIYENGKLGIYVDTLNATQDSIRPPVLDSLKNGVVYGHHPQGDGKVIDVYYAAPDPTHAGEGREWMAKTTSGGDSTFTVTVGQLNCPGILTATATDKDSNTSAFSLNLELKPLITNATPTLNEMFLFDIDNPATKNEYTLGLNWKEAPRWTWKVQYQLNGKPWKDARDITDRSAKFDLLMGAPAEGWNAAGPNILMVKTSTCFGESDQFLLQPKIITKPAWIKQPISAFTVTGAGDHVEYKVDFKYPDPPWNYSITLPYYLPYVGGAWGLKDTYSEIYLRMLSNGSQGTDKVTFRTGFSLGKYRQIDLFSDKGVSTTILQTTPDNVDLVPSTYALFNVSEPLFSHTISIFDLIPGATALHSVPLISDLVDAISLKLTANIGVDLKANIDNISSSEVQFVNATATPYIDLAGRIQLGSEDCWCPASLTLTGMGRGQFDITIPPLALKNPRVTMTFSAHATIFGKAFNVVSPNTFTYPAPPPPLTDLSSPFLQKRTLLSADSTETTVLANAPHGAQPRFYSGPGGRGAVVWNGLFGSTRRPSGDVMLKLRNGGSWGNTILITNDIQCDFQPAMAYDGNNHLIVCWLRNESTVFPSDINGMTAFAGGFDIRYAILEATSGSVLSQGSFGSPSRADYGIRLFAGMDGWVHLIYASTNGTTFSGTATDPIAFYHTRWNGAQWESPRTVLQSQVGITSVSAAASTSSKALIALVRDMDGIKTDRSDEEVFVSEWNGSAWSPLNRLTSNSVSDFGVHAAYLSNGNPVVLWARDTSVVGIVGPVGSTERTLWYDQTDFDGGFGSGRLVNIPNGMAFAWTDGGNVFYETSDASGLVWSPKKMLRFTPGFEQSVSAFTDSKGQQQIGFQRINPTSDTLSGEEMGDIMTALADTTRVTTAVRELPSVVPVSFALEAPYPNPFNASTTILYDMPNRNFVRITVHDLLGREIAVLVDGTREPGRYQTVFRAGEYASGIYFVRMVAGDFVGTRKIILQK